MKKQTLLIAFIAVSTISIAQIKPSFGVRAGLSSAGMRGDAISNLRNILDVADGMITTGNRTGFFAGTYANIPLSNIISLEPALYYSQKGYGVKGSLNIKGAGFLGANAKAQLNMQYVDLPVLVKASLSGFEMFAGPQVSYLMQADLHTTAGVLGINLLNTKTNASSQFNPWDVAAVAGIGYRLNTGINITASYDYGLSKVDAGKNLNSYNHAFKVGVGMTF